MPMGEKGTPKSGQLVKWSCVTSLGVLAASLACYMETQKAGRNTVNSVDTTRMIRLIIHFWPKANVFVFISAETCAKVSTGFN